ncbi:MAG: hypothetical protein AB2A00_11235 [Myxococcota bacterium]
MSDDSILSAARRVLGAITGAQLSPATTASSADDAEGVYWSVIARRSGARLEVHTCCEPSAYAAMAHAKPMTSIAHDLPKGAEVEVLRAAAALLELPGDARGIPFVLLSGGSAHMPANKRVCGVALPGARGAPAQVLVGRRHGGSAQLEAIVIGDAAIAAVGLDGYSERFGRVTLREPLTEVKRADVDASWLSLQLARSTPSWTLEGADDVEAVKALLARHAIPMRRLVQVDASTSEWRD